jgi:hypothetical protein
MKNQDLIASLSKDLKPVAGPGSFFKISAATILISLTTLALIVILMKPRNDLQLRLESPAFFAELMFLLLAGCFAAAATIRLRTPGAVLPLWIRRGLAGAFLAAILGFFFLLGDHPVHEPLWTLDSSGWACALTTSLLTFFAAVTGVIFLRRGASTSPRFSAGLLTISALCFGWVGVSLHCPLDQALHLAVWHTALPLMFGLGLGVFFGRRILRW